jgi:hypothetical protein
MADQSNGSGSILVSALTGAAIGAGALTWWLLSRAERRQGLALGPGLGQSPRQGAQMLSASGAESLEERVQRLNVAIDDVRRQLENFSPDNQG